MLAKARNSKMLAKKVAKINHRNFLSCHITNPGFIDQNAYFNYLKSLFVVRI